MFTIQTLGQSVPVETLLPDPRGELQEHWESLRAFGSRLIHWYHEGNDQREGRDRPRGTYPARVGLGAWPWSPQPPLEELKPPCVYWPLGAVRFGVLSALVTSSVDLVDALSANTTWKVRFHDGTEFVFGGPWQLVALGHPQSRLWWLVAADRRYWWQHQSVGALYLDELSTWSTLLSHLENLVGTGLLGLEKAAHYSPNPEEFSRPHDSVAMVLEAAVGSLGHVVSIHPTDKQRVVTYRPAEYPTDNFDLLRDTWVRSSGHVPQAVEVVFRRWVDGKPDPLGRVYSITIQNTQDSNPAPYTVSIHDSAAAYFTGLGLGPLNQTDLQSLAQQLADDVFLWERMRTQVALWTQGLKLPAGLWSGDFPAGGTSPWGKVPYVDSVIWRLESAPESKDRYRLTTQLVPLRPSFYVKEQHHWVPEFSSESSSSSSSSSSASSESSSSASSTSSSSSSASSTSSSSESSSSSSYSSESSSSSSSSSSASSLSETSSSSSGGECILYGPVADRVEDYLRLQRMRVWGEGGQLRCEAAGYDYVYVCCDEEYSSSSSLSGGGSGVGCGDCSDIPAVLTATFADDSGGQCPCIDGVQVQLTYDSATSRWTGSTQACGATLEVEMSCQSNTLVLSFSCDGSMASSAALTITQCDANGFSASGTASDATCCVTMSGDPVPVSVTVTG